MIGITEGDIMSLLGDFERIIILKTLIYDIDLNFLDLEDLEKIDIEAYQLEIENFPQYDLEGMYNSQYDEIQEIFENYKKFVTMKYWRLKREIENLIGDD